MMTLRGKNVLVTGATGFIGGRLVERLLIEEGASVRALVPRFGRAAWLSRTEAEIVSGDVTDIRSLHQAMQGCEVVFHCAAAMGGDPQTMHEVNVVGTENTLKAASDAAVARFVHVSTMAVHGVQLIDGLDETCPLNPGEDPYARTKLASEQLVMHYSNQGWLPSVILRPTIVYGPRSQWWTVDPIQRIKQGQLVLLARGNGIANIVYIDDVVTALLLAAKSPGIVGETFLISGEDTVTWADYFGAYAKMLDRELLTWSMQEAALMSTATYGLDRVITWLRGGSSRSAFTGVRLGLLVMLLALRKVAKPLYKLGRWEVLMYGQKAKVSIWKAQTTLGYHPQFPLWKGMKETEVWLQAQGYLRV